MTEKAELIFWRKARKLILDGYGPKHCHPKDMLMDCAQCQSAFAVAWINSHIDLLEWGRKEEKK